MDDKSTESINDEVIETPTDDSTTSESEAQSDSSAEVETPTDENINNSDKTDTQPEKKSRLDKRIEQLESKKTGIDTTLERLQSVKQQVQQPFSNTEKRDLFSREEREEGAIDPEVLEQRFAERERASIAQATNAAVERINYINQVNDHLISSERIREKPEFQSQAFSKEFEERYELANTRFNPLTNSYEFVPTQTPEEVYSKLKSIIDEQVTRATTKVNAELSKQSSQRPLDPTSQSITDDYSVEDLEKMLWSNPDKVNKIIEKKYQS
jgi:hypothetical protein